MSPELGLLIQIDTVNIIKYSVFQKSILQFTQYDIRLVKVGVGQIEYANGDVQKYKY